MAPRAPAAYGSGMRAARFATVGILPLVLAGLAGCVVVTPQSQQTSQSRPAPSMSAEASSAAVDTVDCGGAPLELTAPSDAVRVTGDCPQVQIEAADLALDLTAADLGSVTVQGERLAIALDDADALTLQGAAIVVTGEEIDAVLIRGDRNTITMRGEIETVDIEGDSNVVTGTRIGSVTDGGTGNAVG